MAGYAANELRGRYNSYLWRRLLAISAEDCYGIMTKEIEALREADDVYNQKRKGYEREPLFISKATGPYRRMLISCEEHMKVRYQIIR